MAVPPFESTSTLPTFILPAYSEATTSIVGDICRQGPHHSAQKSTRTGRSDRSTSWSKLASVKVSVLSPAILSPSSIRIANPEKDSSLAQKLLIQSRIARCGGLPGVVFPHPAAHHFPPSVAVRKRL